MELEDTLTLKCAPASNTFVRLAAILKNTSIGTIYQTASGFIVSWDAGAQRIFGYCEDEVVGRSGALLVPARLHEEVTEILDIVQRGSSIANWQTARLHKDGTLVQVSLSAVPVRDEQSKVIGSAITVQQMQVPVQPISALTRDFLGKMPIGVQWVALDGTIQWVNATMLRSLGLEEAEYANHYISEFLIGTNAKETQERLVAEEGLVAEQISLKGKDGSVHHFLISSKLEWLDGQYATRIFAQEITALRNSEDRAKMALAASGVGAWEYQIETKKFICDENMLELLGLAPGEFGGKLENFFDCIHPNDCRDAILSLTAALEDGHEYNGELRLISRKGVRNVAVKGKVIWIDGAVPARLIGVCHDITERKRAELRERRMSVMEQREEFMATLTHDLKNPLIGANRILELLADGSIGPTTEKQSKLLRQLRQSNHDLLELIYNLINIYKYETASISVVTLQEVDFGRLVKEQVDQLKVVALSKALTFKTDVQSKFAIPGDRIALSRVIQNLCSNAIKFAPTNGIVGVTVYPEGAHLVLEVTDNGPGISPEDRAGLFERFWQGAAGKKYAPGTGLGLYLCRSIVTAHGGTIELVDGEKTGTTIRVCLPVARVYDGSGSPAV